MPPSASKQRRSRPGTVAGQTAVHSFVVDGLAQPVRLDRAIRDRYPAWGRRAVQSAITAGKVSVDGRTVWLCSWTVAAGSRIDILDAPEDKPAPLDIFRDQWLIAADPHLIVVDKPAGLLSEPTRWTQATNLQGLAQLRFGPVTLFHRLDRDTSGVVLLTRSDLANRYLAAAFQGRTVHKEYVAVVAAPNRLAASGVITARLAADPARRDRMVVTARGGQSATTRYEVVGAGDGWQAVRLWPETGRTHQLRVHLQSMAAPILGDRLYAAQAAPAVCAAPVVRLMLHALSIVLPAWDDFTARTFTAPLPVEFHAFLPSLQSKCEEAGP